MSYKKPSLPEHTVGVPTTTFFIRFQSFFHWRYSPLAFILLLLPSLSIAQYNATAFQLSDAADYRGYSICLSTFTANTISTFNEENGFIAVGNRTGPNEQRDSINLLEIPTWPMPAVNTNGFNSPRYGYSFNLGLSGVDELRAVGITTLNSTLNSAGPANIAVTCLARSSGAFDKTVVIVLDCSTFGAVPTIVRTYELQISDGGIYPMGIACSHSITPDGSIYDNTVYVCGFATAGTGMTYPSDPEFRTSKQAFVAKINVDADLVTTKFFNTAVNMTLDPNPRDPSRFNDYDAAHRIRWVHGSWLLISGSCNSTAATSWPNHPSWQVNTSASWVAQIDTATLGIIGQDFIGLPNVGANMAPFNQNGLYGVDVNMTGQGAHPYYLLQNRLDTRGWYMSHVENTPMQLSTPMSGHNSFYFTDSNYQAKSSVLFNQLFGVNGQNNPAHRMTVTGIMRDAAFFAPAHHATFSVGFEADYSAASGTSVTSLFLAPTAWTHHNTNPPFSMALDEPYWFRSDLATWCNPDHAAHYYPRNGISATLAAEEICFMSHFMPAGSSEIVPRFLNADPDGGIGTTTSNCLTFVPLPQYPNYLGTRDLYQMPVDQDEPEIWTETMEKESGLAAIGHSPVDCLDHFGTTLTWLYRLHPSKQESIEIRFAPNPAVNILEVNCGQALTDDQMPVSLNVFDLSGKRLLHTSPSKIGGSVAQFDIAGLAPGMYMARITLGSQTSKSTKLFVK